MANINRKLNEIVAALDALDTDALDTVLTAVKGADFSSTTDSLKIISDNLDVTSADVTAIKLLLNDANLVAENIKAGVTIAGVVGTFTADADATAADIVAGKTAYVNAIKITGEHA